jgi:hypothetical protein
MTKLRSIKWASVLWVGVLLLATAAFAGGASPATDGPHTLTGSKLTLVFADPGSGFTATTGDRLDSLTWIDSTGTPINIVPKKGGGPICGDPIEFFGQSYGEPEGTSPSLVVSGSTSTWTFPNATTGKAKTTGSNCLGALDAKVVTKYTVYTTPDRENEVRIVRKFKFNESTPVFNGHGFRPYVPRLDRNGYNTVLWPNAANTALNSSFSSNCPGDCEVTDWNQRWFADDNGSGSGMLVIRSPKSTDPALLTINWDSFSFSNLSSVVLIQPEGGWKSTVKEIEYLCFYDPTTWPVADRAALILPKSCKAT